MTYTPRTFTLPELKGLSKKQIDVHLALYEGYVKHVNLILDTIKQLRDADAEENAFVINELRRRLGFEFDGMRMHEYYFEQLEEGAVAADEHSPLSQAASERYGNWPSFITHLKEVAGTRGIGWVVTYFDPRANSLHTAFVNDHELGQLAGLPIILAIDLWEHAYMVDYVPAEKKSYVEAFLENVNWDLVNERLAKAAT
ncbi:MAG TPA: Fe-Mn family superoxide dismutase [Candidatus Paceibacterota bacterium]|nr:Fe-Mn family superoxide dismutase [Candidatus Paceibacterota bacterium]